MARIRFFAHFRDTVGEEEIVVMVEGERSIGNVLNDLMGRHPGIRDIMEEGSAIFAVNHEVGDASTVITDTDEIAIFPPVSGG